jgi:hypothetical protein
MKNLTIVLIAIMWLLACAVPQRKVNNTTDQNSAEYKLEEARLTLSKGNFKLAEEMYLAVFNDSSLASEFRQEALFNLGSMYSNDAVSIAEYEIALDYFRLLSGEFPKNPFKEKTNREIRYIRNQIKRLKQNEN